LYSLEELEPWVKNVRAVAEHTSETYVITNNHFEGKAVVNALEIRSLLEDRLVAGPGTLVQHYPILRQFLTLE
jgi:uncharacterized protein YecE (DUF72 family)